MGIILSHDVVPWKEVDVQSRLDLSERMRQDFGLEAIGLECIFFETSQIADPSKTLTQVRHLRGSLKKRGFETIRISLHLPWAPWQKANLDEETFEGEFFADFLTALDGEVDVFTMHASTDIPLEQIKKGNWYRRGQRLERVCDNIKRLSKCCRMLCLENVPLPTEPNKPGCGHDIGVLPSDFQYIFGVVRAPNLFYTLDTSHAWITQDSCRHLTAGKNPAGQKVGLPDYPGFFHEQMPEIQRLARLGMDYYIGALGAWLRHIHFADRQGLNHGVVPGKGEAELGQLQSAYDKLRRLARGKEMIVVGEVAEKDYASCPHTYETLRLLCQWGK